MPSRAISPIPLTPSGPGLRPKAPDGIHEDHGHGGPFEPGVHPHPHLDPWLWLRPMAFLKRRAEVGDNVVRRKHKGTRAHRMMNDARHTVSVRACSSNSSPKRLPEQRHLA